MIGRPRVHVAECDSTQQLLIARASELPEGAIATTDHQTAGRGRLGRSWVDAPGSSLLCSVLLRPPPTSPAPELSLVTAAATAEAVEHHTGLSAQIKWPNDVILDERKVAGILAEMRGDAIVVGIGINRQPDTRPASAGHANRQPPRSSRSPTGDYDVESVLATLLERLSDRYEAWRDDGLDAVFDEISARNFLFGRPLRVGDVAGTGGAIARDGRLEIVTPGRAVLVESGEVEVGR